MLTLLTAFVIAHAALFSALLAWPPFTLLLTAFFKGPTTEQLLASTGSRHLALSAWQHVVFFCGTWGWDAKRVVAQLRVLVTPKPPKGPPPLPPIPVIEDTTDPHVAPLHSASPPIAARLGVFACIVAAMVVAGVAMGCGGSDLATYAPTPGQELGVVSYGTAEESCVQEDASKADKQACVLAVQCAHNRAEAGACDRGSK